MEESSRFEETHENISGQCSECSKYTSTRKGAKYYPARGRFNYEEPPDLETALICPRCQKKK